MNIEAPSSIEKMQGDLRALLEKLQLNTDLELGVEEARSEIPDVQTKLDSWSESDNSRQRRLLQTELRDLQTVVKLGKFIADKLESSPRVSKSLEKKLKSINDSIHDLSIDRTTWEKKMNAPHCTEEKKKVYEEHLRQVLLKIRDHVIEQKRILNRSSDNVQSLLQDNAAHLTRISEQLSRFNAAIFPEGELKKFASNPGILSLEGVKLLSYACVAKKIIERSSEIRHIFRSAEQSCSSCEATLKSIIADVEADVFKELGPSCRAVNDIAQFNGLMLKTNHFNENTCSWSAQHFKRILFWEYPQSFEEIEFGECRAFSWNDSVQISLNISATSPKTRISATRTDIGFDDKNPGNLSQVRACGGPNLEFRTPLYAWYKREVGAVISCVLDTYSLANKLSKCYSGCLWERLPQDISSSLNSAYLTRRNKPMLCKLPSTVTHSANWDVNFVTMLATSSEHLNNFPEVELKREEIGWFYCNFGDWFHMSEFEAKNAEEWYQCGCLGGKLSAKNSSESIGFEFSKDDHGMYFRYLNESESCCRRAHRQILTVTQGQAIFGCVKWPQKLLQQSRMLTSRSPPSAQNALKHLVESLITVEKKLARHTQRNCNCTSLPHYDTLKVQNHQECQLTVYHDIKDSVLSAVEYFMFLFHERVRQMLSSEGLLQQDTVYEPLCPACLPSSTHIQQDTATADNSVPDDDDGDEIFVDSYPSDSSSLVEHHSETACESSPRVENRSDTVTTTVDCKYCPNICTWACEIRICHKKLSPTWSNCLVSKWASTDAHTHIAKMFCTKMKGGSKKNLEDFDALSMLNVLHFCTDEAFADIDVDACQRAINVRNYVSHPSVKQGAKLSCENFCEHVCSVRGFLQNLFIIILSKTSADQIESMKEWLRLRSSEVKEKLVLSTSHYCRLLVPHSRELFEEFNDSHCSFDQLEHRIVILRDIRCPLQKQEPRTRETPTTKERFDQQITEESVCKFLEDNMDNTCELLCLIKALSAFTEHRPD